jgi:hypothetical protein
MHLFPYADTSIVLDQRRRWGADLHRKYLIKPQRTSSGKAKRGKSPVDRSTQKRAALREVLQNFTQDWPIAARGAQQASEAQTTPEQSQAESSHIPSAQEETQQRSECLKPPDVTTTLLFEGADREKYLITVSRPELEAMSAQDSSRGADGETISRPKRRHCCGFVVKAIGWIGGTMAAIIHYKGWPTGRRDSL